MRLIPFEELFCMLGNSHDIVADSCRDPDEFFTFLDTSRWRSFRRKAFNCMNCQEACYAVYYWTLLAFSLIGTVQSICRLIHQICNINVKASSNWYNNQFHVLPNFLLCRLGVIACFFSTNSWVLLAYAVINVHPNYMIPWIMVNAAAFALRLFMHILEAFMGRLWQKLLTTIVSRAMQLFTIALVNQAMHTFKDALKNNSPDKLMLWQPFLVFD